MTPSQRANPHASRNGEGSVGPGQGGLSYHTRSTGRREPGAYRLLGKSARLLSNRGRVPTFAPATRDPTSSEGALFSYQAGQNRGYLIVSHMSLSPSTRAVLSEQTCAFACNSHTAQLICHLAGRERSSSQRPDVAGCHVCPCKQVIFHHAGTDHP